LGFLGGAADWDDGVRAGGGLAAFPLPVGALVASLGNPLSSPPQDAVPSVLAVSALVRFGWLAGDASGPSPDWGLLSGKLSWTDSCSSSLKKVTEESAELVEK